MLYEITATAVVVLHLAFVAFVALGGLLALRWRRVMWIHLPAALWGAWIELAGWNCPLTRLEDRLRRAAGGAGLEGGLVEERLVPLLYPGSLTRADQILLGAAVLGINMVMYGWMVWRGRRKRS